MIEYYKFPDRYKLDLNFSSDFIIIKTLFYKLTIVLNGGRMYIVLIKIRLAVTSLNNVA